MSTSKRGFASMDPAKRAEICSKGGKAAHAKGTAHKWTSAEAQAAGRKGGIKSKQAATPNTVPEATEPCTCTPGVVSPTCFFHNQLKTS